MGKLTLQPAFTSGELAPSLSARVDLSKYQQGCRTLRNFKVQPHGGAVKRPGFLLLDELPGEAALIRFVFNKDQAYCLAFGEKWLRVFTADGPVLNSSNNVYQITTPYTLKQAQELSVAQSADVLFMVTWGVAPQKLKRRGHAQWEFETITFVPPLAPPSGVSITKVGAGTGADYVYYVTAINAEGKESELSSGAAINGSPPNNWTAGERLKISWNKVKGAIEYRVYKSFFGSRPGYLALVTGTTFTDINVAASLTEGSPKYVHPFPNGDYPGVVSFFEQRLVFASSPNRPQTIWLSKSGDYGNFARYTPLADDSPLELTIASSEVSSMCWLVALRSMVLGSTSMEWEVSSNQAGFTTRTAQVKPQSYIGSSKIPAIIVGNTVLHVSRSGAQVRDLKYDFGADSYGGTDCTIMASHLLERYRITDWAYQQHPDSVVWAVREDGVLLGFTYQPEHDVYAWHRHDTQGEFKAVCSSPQGRDDAMYAVIKRRKKYFLERMADQYLGGDHSRSVFMDCALIYDEPGIPVDTVKGLDHLEGLTVSLLVNGAVEFSREVKEGKVTLDQPGDLVIVGLPFVADLESMPVEILTAEGASVGRKKRLNAINILFHQTVGAKVGINFKNMETSKWRRDEKYGDATRPFSGIKSLPVSSLSENVITVCIRSDSPTPMTILALMPQMQVN